MEISLENKIRISTIIFLSTAEKNMKIYTDKSIQ